MTGDELIATLFKLGPERLKQTVMLSVRRNDQDRWPRVCRQIRIEDLPATVPVPFLGLTGFADDWNGARDARQVVAEVRSGLSRAERLVTYYTEALANAEWLARTVEADSKRIESTSETRWDEVPSEWKDVALNAVVDSGHGSLPVAVVAVITSTLWERFAEGGSHAAE